MSEPKHIEVAGVGVPVTGEEDDDLLFTDDAGQDLSFGIVGLLRSAGARPVRWQHASALEYEGTRHQTHWQHDLDECREQHGARYPTVYRIRLTAEVTPLGEAEAEAFWKVRQHQEIKDEEEPG